MPGLPETGKSVVNVLLLNTRAMRLTDGLGTGYWNQVKCTSRQYRARLASLKRFAMLPTRSKVEEGCKKGPTSCPTNYRFKTSEIKPPEWVSSVSRSPPSHPDHEGFSRSSRRARRGRRAAGAAWRRCRASRASAEACWRRALDAAWAAVTIFLVHAWRCLWVPTLVCRSWQWCAVHCVAVWQPVSGGGRLQLRSVGSRWPMRAAHDTRTPRGLSNAIDFGCVGQQGAHQSRGLRTLAQSWIAPHHT